VGCLEKGTQIRCVVLWAHHTETDEQAKARWTAEHPGEDLDRIGQMVTVIRWAAPQ
jgi:hypothetical protein